MKYLKGRSDKMCLYTTYIRNRRYTKTKKNGGVIPPIKDARVLMVPIGCTRCIECRKKKSREWQVRLSEDIKRNEHAQFVTLSFSEEALTELTLETRELKGYQQDNAIAKLAVRRFLERWRKKYGRSVRHWITTELGQTNTERLHLHGIIYTDKKEAIRERWQYGHVYIGEYVNERTINYISKYITKRDEKHRGYEPIILCSKGIGQGYERSPHGRMNRYKGGETREEYTTRQGTRIGLPIYYRNKLYTEDEREKLWLLKLDKEERWVCGEKYKNRNFDHFIKATKYHRERSERLGYGSCLKHWEQEKWENDQRRLLAETRIKKYAPAAWQLESYANATDRKNASHIIGTGALPQTPGFSKRDLDIMDWWEEGDITWRKKIWKIENKIRNS